MSQTMGPYFGDAELGVDQAPTDVREKMFLLVQFGLNPIRKKFGPIKITSGYRSAAHNASVGGVETSQHLTGEAVDFLCPNVKSMREVFEFVRTYWPGQLIFYSIRGHVHIALPNITLFNANRLAHFVNDEK